MTDFEASLDEKMKNPELLAEMEALEPEMEAIRDQLDATLDAEGRSEWRWALVGNIVESHSFGEDHEVRVGSKAFPPGAKVYIAPAQWGDGYENVVVIGRPRRYHGFIEMVIKSDLIENFRLKKVFDPSVLRKMRESKYSWWSNSDQHKEIILGLAENINQHRATGNPQDAELVASRLSDAQLKFIEDEFGLGKQAFRALSDTDLDDLYNEIGDIEAHEVISADARGSWNLSERGDMAASIVTLIGKMLGQSSDEVKNK